MNSVSVSAKDINQLKSQLQDTISKHFQPTVAITFCDPNFNIEGAIDLFNESDIQLIGCTTAGEIYDDKLIEGTFTALLMDLPKEHFFVLCQRGEGNDYFEPSSNLGSVAKQQFENPAIIVYSGGIGVDGESIVKGIKSQFDKEIPIYGGQGADHFKYIKVSTYTNKGTFDNGISAIVLNRDKIEVGGQTYAGWDELGKLHVITKAKGNIIYEIDHKPALDLFNNYFPTIEYKQKEGSEKLFTIPGIYPLKIKRPDGIEFLRSGMIYDFENNALVLAGAVKEGDEFKFCPTPNFEVVETTISKFKSLAVKDQDVEAIIINSCAGRHFAFGPMFEDEVEALYKLWNKPTIGYMAYGEIGTTGKHGVSEFHNVSCSLVTLKEK